MLAPVLTSLAVVLPAVFAVSELITLRNHQYRHRRAQRAIRRRVIVLLASSAFAAAIAAYTWRG